MPIAPSTHYDHVSREPSKRQIRDEALKPQVERVHAANYGVYGARKVWLALRREGVDVARCTVERLMAELGLAGAIRGKVNKTTIADPAGSRPPDLVHRQFGPSAPNRLWVADLTYVSTWSGWAYVVDAYARRILGWRVATTMNTTMVLDSIEQAIWTRQREGICDLKMLFTIRIGVRSTRRSGSPNASPKPASNRRSVRPAVPMTMRWPKPSTGCTRRS